MKRPGWPDRLTWLLFAGDLLFMLLHLAWKMRLLPDLPQLSIEADGGYAEWFQYLKEGIVVASLLLLQARFRSGRYWVWAALFAYILLDDAFQGHERVGQLFGSLMDVSFPLGLKAHDIGEFVFFLLLGAVFWLLLARLSDDDQRAAEHSATLLGWLVLLALFGMVIDLVHAAIKPWPLVHLVLGFIEDSGEMLVMSGIAGYVIGLVSKAAGKPCQRTA